MFYKKLIEDNGKFNLTSVTAFNEVAYKHFIDSIFCKDIFGKDKTVAEIGSGAGFPSIPLAIERPDLKFTLIESNNKKCNFLKEVKDMLCLNNVTVICDRAENVGKDKNYRETFDYAIARAVAPIRTLVEYAVPLIDLNGRCVFWKGDNFGEELKDATNAIKILKADIKEEEQRSYDLGEYGKRALIVISKNAATPARYPRGLGKERKCPL